MNKFELTWQENEPSLNIKSCLVISSSSAHVRKKWNEQVWTFNIWLGLFTAQFISFGVIKSLEHLSIGSIP